MILKKEGLKIIPFIADRIKNSPEQPNAARDCIIGIG